MQDKDLADKRKSGIDNLAKAIDLDAKDGSGWEVAGRLRQRAVGRGIAAAKGHLLRAGRSDHRSDGVRGARQGDADRPVGVGLSDQGRRRSACRGAAEFAGDREARHDICVRVLPDSAPPANANEPFMLHVATPSGKAGYVDAQVLSPLGGDQMCYTKDAGGWKIAGYLGGVSQ